MNGETGMSAKRFLLIDVLACFAAFTGWVIFEHGLVGLFESTLASPANLQVALDLVIALGLFVVWMFRDARERGLSPYLYAILIFATGSIGALVYLIRREYATGSVSAPARPRPAHG